jgi:predicted nucleic acid-binding protein
MKDKIFIDSNIFLYTLDCNDKKKQNRAREFILSTSGISRIVISTQVLNEVFAVATRKLKIEPLVVKSYLKSLNKLETIIIDPQIIGAAIDYSIIEQISYWDALMVAAAETANCSQLITEDLSSGQKIKGVQIKNPF